MNTLKLPETTEYLHRIAQNLPIPATPGMKTFLSERGVFKFYFDTNITNWNLTSAGPAQGARTASVYHIKKGASLPEIIRSLKIDEESLLWQNQEQIMAFMALHTEELQPERWANFFPYSDGKRPFNFRIDYKPEHDKIPAGFDVFVYPFRDDAERSAALSPYLIVPEQG